jgi:hypothetical protein
VIELVNGSYDTSPSTNSRVASSGGAILEYTLPVSIWTLLLDSLHMLVCMLALYLLHKAVHVHALL